MKKIDLAQRVMFIKLFTGYNWDVRPSWHDKIEKSLRDKDIRTWRNLCKLSEVQLLSIDYISPVLVNQIKDFLGSAGLHLGMSEKELDAYQDTEYLNKHPEEVVYMNSGLDVADIAKKVEHEFLAVQNETKQESCKQEKLIPIDCDEHKDFDEVKAYKKAMAKILNKNYLYDIEWMRHQVVMAMFTHQNFLIKIFCPFKTRLDKAIKKAEIVMKEYYHNMALRSVVYDKLCHDGVIKEWLGEDDFKHGLRL